MKRQEFSSFESFCAEQLIHQHRVGCEIPVNGSFSYFQWKSVAKKVFAAMREEQDAGQEDVDLSNPRKQARIESALCSTELRTEADPLAKQIAQQLWSSLFGESPNTAQGCSSSLSSLSMPSPNSDLDMALSVAEVILRLTLTCMDNAALAQVASRVRPNLRAVQSKGVIKFHPNCYPSIYVLMDLLSLRIIAVRFDHLSRSEQMNVISSAKTVCCYVKSTASEACLQELNRIEVLLEGVGDENASTSPATTVPALIPLIADLSTSLPYDFPSECRDVLCSLPTPYQEPTGTLVFATEPQGEESSKAGVVAGGSPPAKDDYVVRGGGIRPSSPQPQSNTTPSKPVTRSAASSSPSSGNHRTCSSKYHSKFSSEDKHGSRQCRFCAPCHALEILFNDCRVDCSWRHWPTNRKVAHHLKAFPSVMQLAIQRLQRLSKGEALPPLDLLQE